MRALNYKAESTFYIHKKAGKFDRFLLRNPIGLARYSGRLVERYLDSLGVRSR